MSEINDWNTAAANNNDTPPDGWPEGTMQYSEVNNTAREGMAVVARYYQDINGSLSAGGSADAYTLILNAGHVAYFAGMYFACSIPADNTGASTLNVNGIGLANITNRDGSALSAGVLQNGGVYEFRYDGSAFQLMGTIAGSTAIVSGLELRTNINTATPPTTEGVVGNYEIYDNDGTDLLAQFGYEGSHVLRVRNRMHGGGVAITGEDNAGAVQSMLEGDPDGDTSLFNAGTPRIVARAAGAAWIRSDGNTDTEERKVGFVHSDGTLRGQVGHNSSYMSLRNVIHGQEVRIEGEDAGGTLQTLLSGDPDGAVELNRAGTRKFRTIDQGIAVVADINTATPPTTEAVTSQVKFFELALTDELGFVGYQGTSVLALKNRMHGAPVRLEGEDAGGTARLLFQGDPDEAASMYYAGTQRWSTATNGHVALRSDGNTDTEDRYINFLTQSSSVRGRIGHVAGSALRVESLIHGATVSLRGEDNGGVSRVLVEGDPDGAATLYHAGVQTVGASDAGTLTLYSVGNTDAETRLLRFRQQGGTTRAQVGYDGATSQFEITSRIHGANILIAGEDAGGALRTILTADPDANTTLRADQSLYLETNAGESSIECAVNGGVRIYYNGQEQFRTADETGNDIGVGAEVRHNDDSFYPVGMNVIPPNSDLDSGNVTLTQANVGKMLTYNTGTAHTLNLTNASEIKVGATWGAIVGPSGGTLTADAGTGVVLRWWDGSAWTDTATGGTITMGEGQHSIYKETDTLYVISGPNLS